MVTQTTELDDQRLLTREDVARRLAMSVATVDRLIAAREIKATRIGRAVRIRMTDFSKYLRFLEEIR